jgi:hypothetical protein
MRTYLRDSTPDTNTVERQIVEGCTLQVSSAELVGGVLLIDKTPP